MEKIEVHQFVKNMAEMEIEIYLIVCNNHNLTDYADLKSIGGKRKYYQ